MLLSRRGLLVRGIRHYSSSPPWRSNGKLDQAVVSALKSAPLPGLSLVVLDHPDRPPTYRNLGISKFNGNDFSACHAMSSKDLYALGGSMQKHFLAVLVAQLHVEGRLSLDDPVLKYLPELKFAASHKEPVTLRHLLSHTSGIREWRNRSDIKATIMKMLPLPKAKSTSRVTLEDYYIGKGGAAAGLTINLVGKPGAQHIKSHHNYGLAALVVQRVTGTELRDNLSQRIFKPLQMNDTDILVPAHKEGDLVDCFVRKRDGIHPTRRPKWDASSGRPIEVGGGLYTTAEDVSKYLGALVNPGKSNGVISEALLDELLRPVYRRDAWLPAQALSFSTEHAFVRGSGEAVQQCEAAYVTDGQGMGWGGGQAVIVFSRKEKVAVAALTNAGSDGYEMSGVAAGALQDALRRVAASAEAQTARTHVEAEAKSLSKAMGIGAEGFEAAVVWPKICGVYQLPFDHLSARGLWTLGGEVEVYVQEGKLRCRALWGPLRTVLFGKEKGLVMSIAQDCNPLHYVVTGAQRPVLSTPVRGTTDVAFDVNTGEMHIGLLTLRRAPAYRSIRLYAMVGLAYYAITLIGRGKGIDILSSLFLWS